MALWWRSRATSCAGSRTSPRWKRSRRRYPMHVLLRAGLARIGAAALATRLAGHDRDRHAGDAVLLHLDVAQQRHAAVDVGHELRGADLLAQHCIAVAQRLELDLIEIERKRRRWR